MQSPSPYRHQDPVSFLKEVFDEKSRSNPKFSLRAFAAKLGLAPASLHRILARQKRLSVERSRDIAKRLGLAEDEGEYFSLLVHLDGVKSIESKSRILDQLKRLNPNRDDESFNLTIEHFKVISEWYGLAILALVTAVKPRGSARGAWTPMRIAQSLKIGLGQVEATLDRLQKLELIEKTSNGAYVRTTQSVLVTSKIPNEAIRSYYRGVNEKSAESLTAQTPNEKVTGTEVFAFDPSLVPEATRITNEYLLRMRELGKSSKHPTELYQVFTNFFRLTTSSNPGVKS